MISCNLCGVEWIKIKVKVKLTLEQAQRGSRVIALLFL